MVRITDPEEKARLLKEMFDPNVRVYGVIRSPGIGGGRSAEAQKKEESKPPKRSFLDKLRRKRVE